MHRTLLLFCVIATFAARAFACDAAFRPETGPAWNGWGAGITNARYQAESGIRADQVPALKLKWAFGFPDARSVIGQPSLVGGRIFIGVDTGHVCHGTTRPVRECGRRLP
jgi:hypothetical protein